MALELSEGVPGSAPQNDKWWGCEIPMALELSEGVPGYSRLNDILGGFSEIRSLF